MKYRLSAIALIVSAVYVFYNACLSGTILYFDAVGFEQLGRELASGQWGQYLSAGPNREPLYPLFLALNIKAAQFLHVPHIPLIILSQAVVLLLAQFVMFKIFVRARVPDVVAGVLLLYFVISPTVLRSSLIVYSEIITFPLMLWICWVAMSAWQASAGTEFFTQRYKKWGIYLGAVFVPIVFVKGIFEIIAPATIIILGLAMAFKYRANEVRLKKVALFIVIALSVFAVLVVAYKAVNYMKHGNFTFTNRGSHALYGTTARRALPTTAQEDAAQKWYVFADKSICEQHVNPLACAHWFYLLSDTLGGEQYVKYQNQGKAIREIDQALARDSFGLMLKHPIKILNGMFWEGAKLVFWEYPSWGMVILPREIRALYDNPKLINFFMYGVNFLNVVFFALGFIVILWNIKKFILTDEPGTLMLLIALVVLFIYIAAHSFFFLNERNALPIVPVFLVLYGCLIKHIFSSR